MLYMIRQDVHGRGVAGKKASDGDDATLVIDSGILLSDLVDGNSWLMLSMVGMDSSEPVADKDGGRIGG